MGVSSSREGLWWEQCLAVGVTSWSLEEVVAPVQDHIFLQMSFTFRKLIFLIKQKYPFFLALIPAYQTLSTFDTFHRVFPLLSLLLLNFPSALFAPRCSDMDKKERIRKEDDAESGFG